MTDDPTTRKLEILIERLKAGDDSARWELLERALVLPFLGGEASDLAVDE